MISGLPSTDEVYVGPARVLACEADGRPRVQVLGGACDRVVADWAIPFRYEPETGDLLLVLGQHGRYWVTGVVHGRGRSQLAFRGDTELHATGTLKLGGDGGVRVHSETVRIETELLESEAESVVQHFGESDTCVRGEIDERVGECSRMIDGEDEQIAGRHETIASHAAKVDGGLLRFS